MSTQREKPVWPHLSILVCLFALSIAVPRSWERLARPGLLASLRESPETESPPSRHQPHGEPKASHVTGNQSPQPPPEAEDAEVRFSIDQPLPGRGPTREAGTVSPAVPPVVVSDPRERLAMVPSRSLSRPSLAPLSAPTPDRIADAEPLPAASGWTVPTTLLAELDALPKSGDVGRWADAARVAIERLTSVPRPESANFEAILSDLRTALGTMEPLVDDAANRQLQTGLLRVKYALTRRLDLWETAETIETNDATADPIAVHRDANLDEYLGQVAVLTEGTKVGQAWRQYLLLDALQATVDRGPGATEWERRDLARQVLARLLKVRGNQKQREFVQQESIAALDVALRRWTNETVDPQQLWERIERYEETRSSTDAQDLSDMHQALIWSSSEAYRMLGKRLEQHYRNANLRIAVTDDLINRFVPKQSIVADNVRDRILGADVEGRSVTTTNLGVRLVPHAQRLQFGLEARGVVSTDTASTSGPATFYSEGQIAYLARKMIVVDRDGLHVGASVANANARSDLIGVDTDFDDLPIVRSLVRSVATNQHSQSQDSAREIMEQRAEASARRRMDEEADAKISAAVGKLREGLWATLQRLGLEPTPIALQTTEQRVVARLRLASDHQVGAHTPRPRAPSDSLASLQLHESALNNALAKFQFDGATLTLPEMYDRIGDRIGHAIDKPDDLPTDVEIIFAQQDAVAVHFIEGKIRVTLRLAEIAARREHFHDIQVEAYYVPVAQGMQCKLVRDGAIHLRGQRLALGDQIVLRGVFAKAFSKNRPWVLVSPQQAADPRLAQLQFSETVIEDGWLGLAIGPRNRLATQKAGATTR